MQPGSNSTARKDITQQWSLNGSVVGSLSGRRSRPGRTAGPACPFLLRSFYVAHRGFPAAAGWLGVMTQTTSAAPQRDRRSERLGVAQAEGDGDLVEGRRLSQLPVQGPLGLASHRVRERKNA